jgi:ligand-binding sensor domain-containing protein
VKAEQEDIGDKYARINENKNENDMKRIILSLVIALATFSAHAQLTDWQNISSKNFVTKIIHDKNFLYVGTKGGGIVKIDRQNGKQTVLKRADGSMTGNAITDMALHDGELWVGTEYNGLAKVTDGGIEKYDMKNAGFQNNQYFSGFYFNADGTMLSRTSFEYDDKGRMKRATFLTPGAASTVTALYTYGPVYAPEATE